MKTRYYFFLTGLIALLSATTDTAQAQVSFNGISIGAGYWQPSLDYWNNRSMLTGYNKGQGAKLSGAVMPTVGLEVGLTKGLSLGVSAGYWKQSVSSDLTIAGINRNETFALSLIPVSLEARYRFGGAAETGKTPFLTPYIGAGLSRYYIKNDFTRKVIDNSGSLNEMQTGSTNGLQAFAGAEKKIAGKLYVGLEARYHLGSYKQAVANEAGGRTSETVSINGLEANASLRLRFAR